MWKTVCKEFEVIWQRLSSTNFTWFILEYLDPFEIMHSKIENSNFTWSIIEYIVPLIRCHFSNKFSKNLEISECLFQTNAFHRKSNLEVLMLMF